jgi:putative transposase
LIQRGNDRSAIFFADDDYARYREWLIAAAAEHGVSVHAHVLMTNHVHLLLTPETAESLPRAMQSLGRRYVRFVNTRYRRTGTLWEGRYRAAPIDSDRYFFSCCRYIELNPVRARMVDHPRHYRWSSYRAHAEGKDDALAAFHPVFRRLGRTVDIRQEAYRAFFKEELEASFIDAIRSATNGGWALGEERFRKEIAAAAKRRAAPLPRGPRPSGRKDDRQLDLL